MNYIDYFEKYSKIKCDNQLFVICRNLYSDALNNLLICKDPNKKIKYKTILNSFNVLLRTFLEFEFKVPLQDIRD